MWNERNICLSWDDTLDWFSLLGIVPVPVLFDGIYDESKIRSMWLNSNWNTSEGYVLRIADELQYGEFKSKMGKFVRSKHNLTTPHWMHGRTIIPNKLST